MAPFRIAGVELDTWESNFVETTVAVASGIDIADWQYASDSEAADVVLVNAESRFGERFLRRKAGGRPVVVRCVGSDESLHQEGERALGRPFGYTELIALLQDIETELRSDAASDPAPAVAEPGGHDEKSTPIPVLSEPIRAGDAVADANNAPLADGHAQRYLTNMVRPAKRFFEVTRLLGVLKHIVHQDRAMRISHPDYPTITVFPSQRFYTARQDPLQQPELFRATALEFHTRYVDEPFDLVTSTVNRHQPLWKLFYFATLYGSEGRLLPHYQPEDDLHLIAAPDFSAVPSMPEHRALAAYMTQNTASLEGIAAATHIDVRTVIDFCNACEEIGLVAGYSSEPRGAMIAPQADIDHNGSAEAAARILPDDDTTGSTSIIERVKTLFR